MQMFKQIGEFKPDSLIAGNSFPILKEGIGLKAGQGVLKRGTLIARGSDKAGYAAGTVVTVEEGDGESKKTYDLEMTLFGILTDDVDTGTDKTADNIPAVTYQSGEFNREAITVAGENADIGSYEEALKGINIYLRRVQKYE